MKGPEQRTLEVGEEVLAFLRVDAEAAWPKESCGVLFGVPSRAGARVERAVSCANGAGPDASTRYELDLREVLRAERLARTEGLEIVGFFHSHPTGPAAPSADDLREAWWEGVAYVITSVEQGRAAETRAFTLRADSDRGRRFAPDHLQVTPVR